MQRNKNQDESSISIVEARKALGMTHRNYSDEQIQEIVDIMTEAAEFAYDEYVDSNHC